MSDILTNLYINIDNLNYLENPRGIDYNDINLLNTKRRQTLIVPSLCLLSTLLISRFRPKLGTISVCLLFVFNRLISL